MYFLSRLKAIKPDAVAEEEGEFEEDVIEVYTLYFLYIYVTSQTFSGCDATRRS
jgi:hypothetical protein